MVDSTTTSFSTEVIMKNKEIDELTGLLSKSAFDQAMEQKINGKNSIPVSIAFLDIDNFLKVNDTYGHARGDEVLSELARAFNETFTDDAARTFRIGGDEFGVMLQRTEKEQAFLLLERVREAFSSMESLNSINPHPTISAGVATYPDDGASRQEIIRKADDALFRAKGTGRNRFILAREEKKIPKTSHYTQGQLERLTALSQKEGVGEAELLREALDDLLQKYRS